MKGTIALPLPVARRPAWAVVSDYVELTKPRIAVLVLATVAAAAYIAAEGRPDPGVLLAALAGTALVAGSASVINQILERDIDGSMARTRRRPLPTGRVGILEAAAFAMLLAGAGLVVLVTWVNLSTALCGALSLVLYSFVYTPLKPVTILNTLVGAVPGALPPVIGWLAVRGRLEPEALTLFAILFCWQFPHFLAIAWIYRDDYAAGKLAMLPTTEIGRRICGVVALLYALALVMVSLLPAGWSGMARFYPAAALALGLYFVVYVVRFVFVASDGRARGLLWSSLVYLPTLFALLVWCAGRRPA